MKLVEIKNWSDERLITQNTPSREGFNAMITEELGEGLEAALMQNQPEFVDALCDISVFAIGEIYKYGFDAAVVMDEEEGHKNIADWLPLTTYEARLTLIEEIVFLQYKFLEATTTEERIEHMKNMTIMCYRELVNMGYDPDKCMDEVMKVINSRVGAYCEDTKKWQKDKSEAAQAMWYATSFENCMFDANEIQAEEDQIALDEMVTGFGATLEAMVTELEEAKEKDAEEAVEAAEAAKQEA